MAIPIRTTLVIPADDTISQSDIDKCDAIMRSFIDKSQKWFSLQMGYKPIYDYQGPHRSLKTTLQLQTEPNGVIRRDAFGEGIAADTVFAMLREELGWTVYEDTSLPAPNYLWFIVMRKGGGYAGGFTPFAPDISNGVRGITLLGDWGLTSALTGKPAPGCIKSYSTYFCTQDGFTLHPLEDGTHELGHALGCDSHNPYFRGFTRNALSTKQKADILYWSKRYFEKVPVPVDITTTVSGRVIKWTVTNFPEGQAGSVRIKFAKSGQWVLVEQWRAFANEKMPSGSWVAPQTGNFQIELLQGTDGRGDGGTVIDFTPITGVT